MNVGSLVTATGKPGDWCTLWVYTPYDGSGFSGGRLLATDVAIVVAINQETNQALILNPRQELGWCSVNYIREI